MKLMKMARIYYKKMYRKKENLVLDIALCVAMVAAIVAMCTFFSI